MRIDFAICWLAIFSVTGWAQEKTPLSQALTLHVSFDKGLDADYSSGDKTLYTGAAAALVRGLPNEEVKLARGEGKFGDALWFTKKGAVRPQFKGTSVLNYNAQNWSATVSVWLRLDPDKDLEPGYCDPVQIVGDDSKKGFIFLEWSKDESPRFFRYAIRPLFHIWNPTNVQWADIPFEKRPMVQISGPRFARSKWTNVVFTLENINDKNKKPIGKLYIDSRLEGKIENWDLTFGWDPSKVMLVLGSAYVGYQDELSVFNRALSGAEVKLLYELPKGVADLY